MKLPPIIYEDKDVFVFNKPAGLMVHGDGRSKEITLSDMLGKKYPKMKKVGEPMKIKLNGKEKIIYRPGIVHRLDRDTSGALIVSRNQEAFDFLKKQFQNRTVEKKYLAVVYGKIKDARGVINRPIGRSKSDFRKWSAERGTRGEKREAVTNYRVLKRFSDKGGHEFSLLQLIPKTGRTHQIRVHLKAINHPIVGDTLYAGGRESALGLKRPALHAQTLSFYLSGGKKVRVEAPMPKDIAKAVSAVVE